MVWINLKPGHADELLVRTDVAELHAAGERLTAVEVEGTDLGAERRTDNNGENERYPTAGHGSGFHRDDLTDVRRSGVAFRGVLKRGGYRNHKNISNGKRAKALVEFEAAMAPARP